jgi:osmoprotectant transport system permease protein
VGTEDRAVKDLRDAFPFIADHVSLLLHRAATQLQVAAIAMAIALVIAVPIGVWLGHAHRGQLVAVNVANILRAVPSLALIAILIAPLGLGQSTLILALVVLAVPPIMTNAYTAVDGVDRDVVDAARGMGMREREILLRVELPLALPLLFAAIRTAAVYVVATVTIGALAGTVGGLGDIIVDQASYKLSGVLAAAICVAVLALGVDALFAGLQRLVTPRGLRASVDYAAIKTEATQRTPAPAPVP